MKNIITKLTIFLICLVSLTGCLEEETAFTVVESPVLAVFDEMSSATAGNFSTKATFFELDKSGILDQNIGIDSTLISGLDIKVYVNESILVQEYVTDASGEILFDEPIDNLAGSTRLEWVGTYDGQAFRIYQNF